MPSLAWVLMGIAPGDRAKALAGKLPPRCEGCDKDYADPPSRLCPGCQAYRDHQC